MTKQQTQGILSWLGITLLAGLAGIDLYNTDFSVHWPANLLGIRKYLLVLVALIGVGVWIYCLWLVWKEKRPPLLNRVQGLLARIPLWLRGLLSLAVLLLPAYFFLYSHYGFYFSNQAYWLKLAVLSAAALAAYLILFPQSSGLLGILQYSSMVCLAGAFYAMVAGLNQVTSYPFSLSWSEGNRFWDYSMMFGIDRYIIPAGKPAVAFIEKGRQFLWSIPFLIPQSGIELMRLWDELVWIIPAFVLGLVAVVNGGDFAGKKGTARLWPWEIFFGSWCYLFLTQGPIYPTLILCAILVVIAALKKPVGQQPAGVGSRLLRLHQPLDLGVCTWTLGRHAGLAGPATARFSKRKMERAETPGGSGAGRLFWRAVFTSSDQLGHDRFQPEGSTGAGDRSNGEHYPLGAVVGPAATERHLPNRHIAGNSLGRLTPGGAAGMVIEKGCMAAKLAATAGDYYSGPGIFRRRTCRQHKNWRRRQPAQPGYVLGLPGAGLRLGRQRNDPSNSRNRQPAIRHRLSGMLILGCTCYLHHPIWSSAGACQPKTIPSNLWPASIKPC